MNELKLKGDFIGRMLESRTSSMEGWVECSGHRRGGMEPDLGAAGLQMRKVAGFFFSLSEEGFHFLHLLESGFCPE